METASSLPSYHSRAGVAAARERRYLPPAPSVAVMWEQMEYLMAHPGSNCARDCPTCKRLEQVERWLLQPFK
jgi:hypothetical protein